MPKIEVNARSFRFTIQALTQLGRRRVRPAAAAAVGTAGNQLAKAIRANVSIPPIGGTAESHARALGQLNHPYAKSRHGAIAISPSGGVSGFTRPSLLVHSVSGALRDSIETKFNPRALTFTIGINEGKAPHAKFVIRGTRVMYGRDILSATAADPVVKRALRETVVRVAGQVFRSQSAVRFG